MTSPRTPNPDDAGDGDGWNSAIDWIRPVNSPRTPRQDRQLLGWIVPDHIGWVETDGYVEITCRAVAGECSQTTSVQNREWIEEFLTRHAHGQPVKPCPVPASQSVPAVPVSSTGGKETGEGAETATEALSVRWYPVGDDTIGGWAIANVDLPVSQLDTRGGKHFTVGDFLSEDIARHLCELHNAALLPDSETERPRRCPAVTPESDLITAGRQCQQYEGHAHDHTWYGDNGTAYSAWRVTS